MLPAERSEAVDRLYQLLDQLRDSVGGFRILRDCDGRTGWPTRGVYFFFDPAETRSDGSPRVVRIGTHALTAKSRTTLWNRLSQHRGHVGGRFPGGGNHRGSIFRLHVGEALIARDGWPADIAATWKRGATATAEIREAELPLEREVSQYIGALPFLWVAVDNPPAPGCDRAIIEAGTIALLSGQRVPVDAPSSAWLGRSAQRATIRESGLWNVRHVDDEPHTIFLDVLERHVEATRPW
jgi:hypothetical protein